ncbi:hypothetical protein GCM10027161_43100 [Microbispora hainanensis]
MWGVAVSAERSDEQAQCDPARFRLLTASEVGAMLMLLLLLLLELRPRVPLRVPSSNPDHRFPLRFPLLEPRSPSYEPEPEPEPEPAWAGAVEVGSWPQLAAVPGRDTCWFSASADGPRLVVRPHPVLFPLLFPVLLLPALLPVLIASGLSHVRCAASL